ncbi:MAG: hypothetical protein MMC23_007494 [Stictis urceolatum]|nr:hypothetical protein [Stictis urceolata]
MPHQILSFLALGLLTLSIAAPLTSSLSHEKRFASGHCKLHVTQHQKNEYGIHDKYQFDLRLYDAIGEIIGGENSAEVADLESISSTSQLPYTIDMSIGKQDSNKLRFSYAGETWFTGSSTCSVGGYDSGRREMDCHFTC